MELCGDGFSVTNVRRVKERLRCLKGIHLTAHDLLRTFVAIAKHAGVPDDAISMLMNHEKTLAIQMIMIIICIAQIASSRVRRLSWFEHNRESSP